jgi:two-component system, OmpR family, KDP operon response regulator KdpE
MTRVLIVEDERKVLRALERGLQTEGYEVTGATTGDDGLDLALGQPFDCVVLDVMLPGRSGLEVVAELRRAGRKVPVLLLTARDAIDDRVHGLDAGADDYLVKPFGPGQIDARVRAVLRRAGDGGRSRPAPIQVGGLWLDGEAYEAVLDGIPLELSRREFDLLHYLAQHAGQVVPKRDLLTHVWRMPYGGADKTIDVHVSWLRRKMGETAQEPRYLYTVRGVGIKLAAPA